MPLYPAIPIAAIILNMFLAVYQFNFDPRAWYSAIIWIIFGLFIYLIYFEKVTTADLPKVLEVQQPKSANSFSYRILVPLHNPDHVIPLMKLAVPIAKAYKGEIIVLGVIDVPITLPPHEAMRFIHHKAPLLKKRSNMEISRELKPALQSTLHIRCGTAFCMRPKRKKPIWF